MIAHRFGHQSGQHERSGRNSTTRLSGFPLVVSDVYEHQTAVQMQMCSKNYVWWLKRCRVSPKTCLRQDCSAAAGAWGYQYIHKCKYNSYYWLSHTLLLFGRKLHWLPMDCLSVIWAILLLWCGVLHLQAQNQIETGLKLVGFTAVEDCLQEMIL